ncbi:MAG: phage tail sheath subtilisin-like domain-containing protein [Candidatus Peribacteraceae bacterium]|nr:phage tail sheath subtilisin-like domain-containing protein [Candidatus Peribacteraceae bacterium]
MTIFISPSVEVTEEDLTLHAKAGVDNIGALAGVFRWGPAMDPYRITQGKEELIRVFGKPVQANYGDVLVAEDFLTYTDSMYIVRGVDDATALNAVSTGDTPLLVKNDDDYDNKQDAGTFNTIDFMSKFPGEMGNGLIVDICAAADFATWEWKDQFIYTPSDGEFSVAVVDGGGTWSGIPERKQVDRVYINLHDDGIQYSSAVKQIEDLTVTATPSWTSGVNQIETLTFTGAAAADGTVTLAGVAIDALADDIKQVEDYTLSGTVTVTGNLTLAGKTIQVTASDDSDTVAGLLATALAADSATYDSAVATLSVIEVTYATPGLKTKLATATSNGITGSSAITTPGQDKDTISEIATKFRTKLLETGTYSAITAASNVLTITYDAIGPQTITASGSDNGVSVATAITTQGSQTVAFTYEGLAISTTIDDTAAVVVDEIALSVAAAALADDRFLTATTAAAIATLTWAEVGPQTILGTETIQGVTLTQATDTAGTITSSFTVQGVATALSITLVDIAGDIATQVATDLAADGKFETAVVNGHYIDVTWATTGAQEDDENWLTTENNITSTFSTRVGGFGGSILEKYELVTETEGTVYSDGTSSYFADAINTSSYVRVGDKSISLATGTTTMQGGADGTAPVLNSAMDLFADAESYDMDFLIAGDVTVAEQRHLIEIAETRADAFAFVSPMLTDVVNNTGEEAVDVVAWREGELNKNNSYFIMDTGWALYYDQYNGVNRWIPTCGGTAGIKARMHANNEAWFSPAGYNRGRYKNYIKLAWSPSKAERDIVYKVGVNPIISTKGEGTVLYGDKTGLILPGSAFEHINVRSAFIVAEKSLANVAKFFLFEFNDEFTRAQFVNAATPMFRDMVARRAFEDFRFIADDRNNTPEAIQDNRMVGSIFLKPLYSINFIELKFVAVPPTLSFDEVETLQF